MERSCLPVRRRRRSQRPDLLGEERASIQAGIDLVASGIARRVVLSGLRFAERLLVDAVERGAWAGVGVRLDRSPDGPAAILVTAASGSRIN
jgi:hypothetical protein